MDKIDSAKKIINVLEANGFQAYFVGGFVRDFLLNRDINDIDIATNAHPEQVMSFFLKTIPTGIKHGTITVLIDKIPFEVTTFRSEGKYLDYRHPSVVSFVSSLQDDLSRRDFTMNAMALSVDNELIDPFDGKAAIDNKLIIAVGNPDERFLEDPLRMLRAIRFAAQLNFNIEAKTWEAILTKSSYIRFIAIERVKQELDKLMNSNSAERGINLLFESQLLYWINGITKLELDRIDNKHLKLLSKTDTFILKWALFLYPLSLEQKNAFTRVFKFSNQEKNKISNVYYSYDILKNKVDSNSLTRSIIETDKMTTLLANELKYVLGEYDKATMKVIDTQINLINNELKVRKISDLAISGTDLIEHFNQPGGPWTKQLLESLRDLVIYEGIENERYQLIAQAEIIYKGIKQNDK